MDLLVDQLNHGVLLEIHEDIMPAEDEFSNDKLLSLKILDNLASPLIASQYGVGTSNLEIFDRIVSKIPFGSDYVYFRDSQYVYSLVYGDLSFSGSSFSGSGVTRIDYNTYTGSSSQPTFSRSTVSSFNLSVGNWLVYSNLGHYPSLGGDDNLYRYDVLTQVCLLLFTMYNVLWGFARLRSRR